MSNIPTANNSLTSSISKTFTRLLLGVSASWFLLPTGKALAERPSMYTYFNNLSISYDRCKDRAKKASNLVLSAVQEPLEGNGGFQIFGGTAVTAAIIHCVETSQGTTFIVVPCAYFSQNSSEAKSVRDRIQQIMLGQL